MSTISNKKTSSTMQQQATPDDFNRQSWIEESAYFIAEARGFIPGYEKEDWNKAEKKYKASV
jgi:hypothetical protein